MIRSINELNELITRFHEKDFRALSKAITLVENQEASQIEYAGKFLKALKVRAGGKVVAISGSPGVGKSTFINLLGQKIVAEKKSLAVLAVDPSSPKHQGSILGDKLRMQNLIDNPKIFVRPIPSKGISGGVSPTLENVLKVVKAFGFDYIFLETVGAGQSEYQARYLSHLFITLMQPGTGDIWQCLKKGLLEVSDIVIINKSEGKNKALAENLKAFLSEKERLVLLASCQENYGIVETWQEIERFFKNEHEQNFISQHFYQSLAEYYLLEKIKSSNKFKKLIKGSWEKKVSARALADKVSFSLDGHNICE